MKHPHTAELHDYCDGNLPEETRVAVRIHLDACARCSTVVAQERAVLHSLRHATQVSPRPDFEERVMTRLLDEGVGFATDRRWHSRYAVLLFGMVVTLAVVVLAILPGGNGADAQPSRFDRLTEMLRPLLELIPIPTIHIDPLSSTHGQALELFAAVLAVLMFLAALDRFVFQPLIKPRSRGPRGVAPGTRGQ